MNSQNPIKGQGAQRNVKNRFERYSYEPEDWEMEKSSTQIIDVFPKTIVNAVKSPDLPMEYSLNPYQGCEHGCSYCYARPTHEYWGFSAGIDFERKIMVKKNAPELLEKFFQKRNYVPKTIMLSGNTDCYQPVERTLEITRKILEVCLAYRHPVAILSKNALLMRDLDLFIQMNELNLISVALSLPTMNEELRRKMEPRTSSSLKKLEALKILKENNIPTGAMIAPIIPGLNSDETLKIIQEISESGVDWFGYTLIRLNDAVEPIFVDWLEKSFPDRKDKVLSLIKQMRGGKLGEKRYFERYKGEGNIAEMIHKTIEIGRNKYFKDRKMAELSTAHFTGSRTQQLKLF
ncbi:radical SAM protein [Cloacibacterium rupense]|uniref:Radical SAM protein n=1 Tax=Cloacibacterium rupense TaxID=517423 RepID=A0ABQ2NKY4_9FLAO|nr:PA0069 family radical SAM protein [Cloacibacterium rupense]GGP03835.1 radical SAM protein [Cloacibacterium rupense]